MNQNYRNNNPVLFDLYDTDLKIEDERVVYDGIIDMAGLPNSYIGVKVTDLGTADNPLNEHLSETKNNQTPPEGYFYVDYVHGWIKLDPAVYFKHNIRFEFFSRGIELTPASRIYTLDENGVADVKMTLQSYIDWFVKGLEFEKATSVQPLLSGDKIGVLFGKIAKWYDDILLNLKALAYKDTVATEQIDDNSVTEMKLSSELSTKINNKSDIGHSHSASDITSGSFDSNRISKDAITQEKILNNSISFDKLDTALQVKIDSKSGITPLEFPYGSINMINSYITLRHLGNYIWSFPITSDVTSDKWYEFDSSQLNNRCEYFRYKDVDYKIIGRDNLAYLSSNSGIVYVQLKDGLAYTLSYPVALHNHSMRDIINLSIQSNILPEIYTYDGGRFNYDQTNNWLIYDVDWSSDGDPMIVDRATVMLNPKSNLTKGESYKFTFALNDDTIPTGSSAGFAAESSSLRVICTDNTEYILESFETQFQSNRINGYDFLYWEKTFVADKDIKNIELILSCDFWDNPGGTLGYVTNVRITDLSLTVINDIDDVPTKDSKNLVVSGGVYDAVTNSIINGDRITDNSININALTLGLQNDIFLSNVLLSGIYNPYFVSEENKYVFQNVPKSENFYIYNNTDQSVSNLIINDEVRWKLMYENDEGVLEDFVLQTGSLIEVYVYKDYITGADYEDGELYVAVQTPKPIISGNQIKPKTIDMDKITPAFQSYLENLDNSNIDKDSVVTESSSNLVTSGAVFTALMNIIDEVNKDVVEEVVTDEQIHSAILEDKI